MNLLFKDDGVNIAKLQRQTYHILTIFVEVPPDYQAKPPRWLLQSPVLTQWHHDSDLLLAHNNGSKHGALRSYH
jgi:hypothetical protein